MHGFVLQDWITIRGGSGISTVNQSEVNWHDLSGFEDLVAWLDIREITLANSTFIAFNLQTAPIKDEYLFVNMESPVFQATQALTAPATRKILMASANVPLGRWFRWQLQTSTTPNATWDVSFRILACANAVGGGGMMMMAGPRR